MSPQELNDWLADHAGDLCTISEFNRLTDDLIALGFPIDGMPTPVESVLLKLVYREFPSGWTMGAFDGWDGEGVLSKRFGSDKTIRDIVDGPPWL